MVERKKRSLSTKVFRMFLLGTVVLGLILAVIIGLALYSISVGGQYISTSFNLSRSASMVLQLELNIFRNHNCPARSNLVQCPDCGEWFEEGNIFRNHNCPAKESYTPDESGKVQCPDCYEWFETEELYLEHDCPEREEPKESFSQDSRAPEQPEEAVESYSQDPQAYDPYQDEPAESYSQDPQAYDSYQDEPIDNGSQDPDA